MNLIDKYIAEVGKHLPRKQRADIEAEQAIARFNGKELDGRSLVAEYGIRPQGVVYRNLDVDALYQAAVQRGLAVLQDKLDRNRDKPSGAAWDNLFGATQFERR